MRHRANQCKANHLLVLFIASLIIQSCGGGIAQVIPEEVRASAKTWRMLYRWDYRGSEFDSGRVTASQRSLVEAVKTELLNNVTLIYNDAPNADITVTIDERQENQGYGQVGASSSKRMTIYYMEFFDRDGERLGGYYDRNQRFIRSSNEIALVRQLAESILIVLEGEQK